MELQNNKHGMPIFLEHHPASHDRETPENEKQKRRFAGVVSSLSWFYRH